MRLTMRILLIAILLITSEIFPSPSLAQSLSRAQLEASLNPAQRRAVESLLTVQRLTLIRESQQADDRQLSALRSAERRLADMLTARDTAIAQSSRASARALEAEEALERARAHLTQLSKQTADHIQLLQTELIAYRDQLIQQAASYTPEEIRLRQRFADGDRVGAWRLIRELSEAWDVATERAVNLRRAERLRADIQLYEEMISRGDPGATKVQLAIYLREAIQFQPEHYPTQLRLAKLERELSNYPQAIIEFETAYTIAPGLASQFEVLEVLYFLYTLEARNAEVVQTLERRRALVNSNSAEFAALHGDLKREVIVALQDEVTRLSATASDDEWLVRQNEVCELIRALRQDESANPLIARDDLSDCLVKVARIEERTGNPQAAFDLRIEGLELFRDPSLSRFTTDPYDVDDLIEGIAKLADRHPSIDAATNY